MSRIFSFQVTPCYRDEVYLRRKYVDECLSIKQIAAQSFSSRAAIQRGLQKFGISIREPHQHHGHPAQPRYGFRLQKGRLVEHQGEQAIISAIIGFKDQGKGLREIARELSIMKAKTKCNKKTWHPEMVRRILIQVGNSKALFNS